MKCLVPSVQCLVPNARTARRGARWLMAVRGMLLLLASAFVGQAVAEDDSAWKWEPALVPKALLIEGLWSDFFRLEPALHHAGIEYQQAYVSRSPFIAGYTQVLHMPAPEEMRRFSVIVIANLDAPAVNPERVKMIREFVSQGGGLVVLGGYWAYSRGAYDGTPLAEMLPVTFPPENRIPSNPGGLVLHAAPHATWQLPSDFAAQPAAFYVQTLAPKAGSDVQLLAGDKPAVVSGTFGKGRVVAFALTANGDAPAGVVPFWDWPQWPQFMGRAIDWAAGARPLTPDGTPGAVKVVLTEDEMNGLALGTGVTPDLARRIGEHPTPQTAEALFLHVMRSDGAGKVTLATVYRTLQPFAKVEWGEKLRESLEKFSPDLEGRQAALVLLGASKDPAAYSILRSAVEKEPTKDAAIEGLGLLGNPEAIPLIRELLARSEDACKSQATEDEPAPGVFARQHGSTIVAAAIALCRLGEPEAVPRLLEVHRRVRLFQRVFENAAKRRVRDTDPAGIAIKKGLIDADHRLRVMLGDLRAYAGPVPEKQLPAFFQAASEAVDPVDVEWMSLAMEQSATALPPATWQPLTKARDGIISRLATALVRGPRSAP
jgi:hypothetical protein